MSRVYRCVIISPSGEQFDGTPRMDIGGLSSINDTPESDLSQMTHGDLTLDLDNSDGTVEAFLQGAAPADSYEVILERRRVDGSGWERMFGGVLDLPYSLSYDDKMLTAHVVAYSYTKMLERTSADEINEPYVLKRTLAYKTASITAGTSQLVFLTGEAADLEIGDVIRLNSGQFLESFTIIRFIDTSNAVISENAGRTFTSAFAEVLTQFFHDKSPSFLLPLIADLAGLDFNDLNLGSPLADFPIATPLSIAGLNVGGESLSLIPVGTTAEVTFDSNWGGKRKSLSAPTGVWSDGATTAFGQYDWTPYTRTEPGTKYNLNSSGNPDCGNDCVDYDTGDIYTTVVSTAMLRKNAVDVGVWTTAGDASNALQRTMEYEIISNRVFYSGYVSASGSPGVGASFRWVQFWDVATGFNDVFTYNTIAGGLRMIPYTPGLNILIMVEHVSNDVMFLNPHSSPVAVLRTIPWGNTTDNILHHTWRLWGSDDVDLTKTTQRWLSVLFERYQETWIAIYDARGTFNDWMLSAQYRVSGTISSRNVAGIINTTRAQQTVMNVAGQTVSVVFAGGVWSVFATHYAGVIRYANFEKSSCAKAARDIAVILNAIVDIDIFKVMSIVNRKALSSSTIVGELGPPLASMRRPISQVYRSSVSATGTDLNGGEINEVQGDQGDSARRITIDSDLITTAGMALATALTTFGFVSSVRGQRDVTVMDDGTIYSAFDRVTLDGSSYIIYSLHTDLEQETIDMVLLEPY